MANNVYVYRLSQLEEILALRNQVLIIGTARNSPEFPGDRDPYTYHFGAFNHNKNVCCLSWMASEWEGVPAYQLRGMATHPEYRGQGIGKELLQYSEIFLKNRGISRTWCNARSGAVLFYQKQGWKVVSEEFMIDGVGMHYKMFKSLCSPEE